MAKEERLKGNPDATMAEARAILRKAREEARGQIRNLRARQAAEKVWLAASTAADAMAGPVNSGSQVIRVFERAWGAEGKEMAGEIELSLHRGCFYGNALMCNGPYIEKHAERLGRLLKKPIRDRKIREKLSKGEK